MKLNPKRLALIAALLLLTDRGLTGCTAAQAAVSAPAALAAPASPSPTAGSSYTDHSDGGHAIAVNGEEAYYSNVTITKTGDAGADTGGRNAAVLAENGAALTLREVSVTTGGTHADAVFALGEGTAVRIADSAIVTTGSGSAGLTAAGGAALNADNLVVHTTGDSSPAIASGLGGTVNVTGGTYDTAGAGSPAVFAAADITVSGAELSANAAQGVVVEGGHAVTLENVTLTAADAGTGGGNARRQAVLLSGAASDEADESAAFTMRGGSVTNLNGDVFLVSGGSAVIQLTAADIMNDDPDGAFLRVIADGESEHGSRAELYTAVQKLYGDLLVDGRSSLALHLWDGSVLTGAVNPDAAGAVSVELTDGARWVLTGDSFIRSLRCDPGSIDLNGFTLTVGGEVYTGEQ